MVRDDAGSEMSVGSTARMVMSMSAESHRVRLWGCGEREVGPERRRDSDEALAITFMITMPMSMTMAMIIKSIEAIEALQNRQSPAERELLTDIQRMRRAHSEPSLSTCGARWGRRLRGCVCGGLAVVWQEGT